MIPIVPIDAWYHANIGTHHHEVPARFKHTLSFANHPFNLFFSRQMLHEITRENKIDGRVG